MNNQPDSAAPRHRPNWLIVATAALSAGCANVATQPDFSGPPAVEYVMARGAGVAKEICPEPAPPESPVAASPVTRYADTDRDGAVTRDEASAEPALLAAFERYDGDRDDLLDTQEFSRLVGDSRARRSEPPTATDEDCTPRLVRDGAAK